MTYDDFSQHPKSITEIKSDQSDPNIAGSIWKPRDALIDVLRNMDQGNIKTDALIVIWLEKDENGAERVIFRQASTGLTQTLGVIEMAKYVLLK